MCMRTKKTNIYLFIYLYEIEELELEIEKNTTVDSNKARR